MKVSDEQALLRGQRERQALLESEAAENDRLVKRIKKLERVVEAARKAEASRYGDISVWPELRDALRVLDGEGT